MHSELKVWLLSDGVPGHVNQAYGLVQWMSERYRMSCLEIPVHIRARYLSRSWMPFLLRRGRRGARVVIWAHRQGIPRPLPFATPHDQVVAHQSGAPPIEDLPANDVDLILSAGGNTSFMNAALASWRGCDNIFIGSRRRLDSDMFTAHLTLEPAGPVDKGSNIVMELVPTLIDPARLRQQALSAREESGVTEGRPVYVLIVGGDGAGFRYEKDDWLRFARMMKGCRDQDGAQWLVTTSRRTGRENDAFIKEILGATLPQGAVLEQVIWSDAPRKVMQRYLSTADRIFVTADSMSMITECISTEKPVILLYPKHSAPNERYRAAIDKFIGLGFCSRNGQGSETNRRETGSAATENKANMRAIRSTVLDRLEERIGVLRSFVGTQRAR
uniref:Fission protein ELM1 n=1 Tax=Candidatus Kentrum sp. FW TaxID=2126338 RepID=A0A450RT39_9GAMM|nr:MAG: hypothetical protein BECKFW1821A_GA0114235_100115 [Candidatus Kentron sp. FW]